eukprot:s2910_g3.t1
MFVQGPVQESMTQPFTAARDVKLQSGLKVWSNVPAPNSQYHIIGDEYSQVLELDVHPGESITCEPGSMAYMSPGLFPDVDVGGCEQGFKRCCCAGENLFRLHFLNETEDLQQVGLTPTFPAKIVPIDLAKYDGMVFNRGAFLAALGSDWSVDIKRVRSMGTCCCGGQGLFMNTLHGSGMVFLQAGGTVMRKELQDGEELVVEQAAVLAFERSVELDIRKTGGFLVCCCGGMGLFNAVLTGPGFVMIHSMGLQKLRSSLGAPSGGGNNGSGGGAAE